jgi:predicted site-specific integrase-resolvase
MFHKASDRSSKVTAPLRRAWSGIMASLRQAAIKLGVHYTTLRRWIQLGTGPKALIKRNAKRSTYRISAKDLDEFVQRNSKGM